MTVPLPMSLPGGACRSVPGRRPDTHTLSQGVAAAAASRGRALCHRWALVEPEGQGEVLLLGTLVHSTCSAYLRLACNFPQARLSQACKGFKSLLLCGQAELHLGWARAADAVTFAFNRCLRSRHNRVGSLDVTPDGKSEWDPPPLWGPRIQVCHALLYMLLAVQCHGC